jgi:transcriptional regulator with XRE-family HTH domain
MIGKYLKRKREELQKRHGRKVFSQTSVAKSLGKSKSYISRVEKGTELPSRQFLTQISRLYDLDKRKTLAIGGYLSKSISSAIANDSNDWQIIEKVITFDAEQIESLLVLLNNQYYEDIAGRFKKSTFFREMVEVLVQQKAIDLRVIRDELKHYRYSSYD